tara:strand:- start:4889 stop:5125 length:237 start_codon:yes stop_codon:yes gene_type:complete
LSIRSRKISRWALRFLIWYLASEKVTVIHGGNDPKRAVVDGRIIADFDDLFRVSLIPGKYQKNYFLYFRVVSEINVQM